MEILVRTVKGYEWKEVDLKSKNTFDYSSNKFATTDGDVIYENNILGIKGDIRRRKQKYVRCGYCGEILPESKWEEHCAKREAKANCINCKKLVTNNRIVEKKQVVSLNEDGTITTKETIKADAICSNKRYYSYNPKESKERGYCMYYACRAKGYAYLPTSAFVKYPKFYEGGIPTVKKLIENGWIMTPGSHRLQYRKYNLYADIDCFGLVKDFYYDGTKYITFMYSSKYKVFAKSDGYGLLEEISEERIFPKSKSETLLKAIKKLYK